MSQDSQRLSGLVLPALVGLGFLACSSEPGLTGAGGGAGGGAAHGGSDGGTGAGGVAPSAGASVTGGQSGAAGGLAGASSGGASGASSGASTGGGGGAGSAGNAGAAGSSGSGGGGPAPAGCAGFTGKFCDDFEGQAAGQPPSGAFSVQGKVTVDTSKAFSGTQSLKISQPTPTGMLRFTEQFPFDDLHGRAMFYVTNIPTNGGPHWDLVVAVANDQASTNWEIGGMYGDWLFIIDPPDRGVGAGTFPQNRWFCLQWQYRFAGAGQDNTFVAKLDGTSLENGEFTGKDAEGYTWNAAPWKSLSVGFTAYGGNIATELWVDDLAFGEAPIACPPQP